MSRWMQSLLRCSIVGIALALMAGGAFAEKPSWAGDGAQKKEKIHRDGKGRDDRGDAIDAKERQGAGVVLGFSGDDRRIIGDYYGVQVRQGHCPPGLAKKHNGCQPPGQAKRWQKGQPLPKDLGYYELPRELRVRLPPPPPQHRYVQVAGDILMIAVGTGLVVDAVEDILR